MDGSAQGAYWAVITAPILEAKTISDGAKLFYCQISRRTNQQGFCWASDESLAQELGIGVRTVQRYVKELADAGFIQRENVGVSDRKRRLERHIRLAVPLPFNPAKNGGVKTAKNGGVKAAKNGGVHKENNKSKNNTPYSPPQGDEGRLFDRFWALYPKKKNKQAALRAWRKLNPDMELCRTMSAQLKAQMRSDEWTRDSGRYIPYPASWLNGRRWEDDVTIPCPPSGAPPEHEQEEAWGWQT